jgi:hypothetical protein
VTEDRPIGALEAWGFFDLAKHRNPGLAPSLDNLATSTGEIAVVVNAEINLGPLVNRPALGTCNQSCSHIVGYAFSQ